MPVAHGFRQVVRTWIRCSDLVTELGQEMPEKPRAQAGFGFSRRSLHGPFELEQLGEHVVQSEDEVIRWSRIAEGIRLIVKAAPHFTSQHQGAGQPHGPQGIETVGILHHLRLQRAGLNSGRKTVGLDGVRDFFQSPIGPFVPPQPFDSLESRKSGCLTAVPGRFWDCHTIMQPGCRHHDPQLRTFRQCQTAGVRHDTPDVAGIVRGVSLGVVAE